MSASQPAFISYSRDDSEFALRLTRDLKAAGAQVWLDQMDIHPGQPWDNAIEEALLIAPQMLLILTPSSAKSDNVRNEISYALDQGKIIIPVLYQDCTVPLRLQRTQRIDFRADYTRGLKALLGYLGVTQPDQGVLNDAAGDEAKRQAAWQAREAEAQRLRDIGEASKREDEQRTLHEAEALRQAQAVAAEANRKMLLEEQQAAERSRQAQLLQERDKARPVPRPIPHPLPTPILPGVLAIVALLMVIGGIAWGGHALFSYATRPKSPVMSTEAQFAAIGKNIAKNSTAKQLEALDDPPAKTSPSAQTAEAPLETMMQKNDYTHAYALATSHCTRGSAEACRLQGYMLLNGTGTGLDQAQALVLFQTACDTGDPVGCDFVGYVYDKALGVKADPAQARKYYQMACSRGDAQGCVDLKNVP